MARRNNEFTMALELAQKPKHAAVQASAAVVTAHLNSVQPTRLSQQGGGELSSIKDELRHAVAEFDETYPRQVEDVDARVKRLKQHNLIRRAAQVILLFISIVFLSKTWYLGILLFIATMIVRSVLKKKFTKKAQQIARESWRPTQRATGIIGAPWTLHASECGLYMRADNLYLSTLSDNERMMEMQRRQIEMQELRSQQRHEDQMGLMKQNLSVQKAMLAEQRMNTDVVRDLAYKPAKNRY